MKNNNEVPAGIQRAAEDLLTPYFPGFDVGSLNRLMRPEMPEEGFLTRQDVALRLNISVQTVDRLLAAGSLGHQKFRRSVRISESALAEFIKGAK